MATAIAPSIEQQWHEERRKGIGGSEVHHLSPPSTWPTKTIPALVMDAPGG